MAEHSIDEYLKFIHEDMKHVRQLLSKLTNAVTEAEGEVPDKIWRFVMYMHAIRDVVNMHEERGHTVPPYILREMERCDDRYRQLLEEMHIDGGAFEKVRREMAGDGRNRWDHTRSIEGPKCACT